MARSSVNPSRSESGFTLLEILLIGAILVVLVVSGLAFFTNVLGGKPAAPTTYMRTEYFAEWASVPPNPLTSAGAKVEYKVQARTDTITNGFVTNSGQWKDFAGAIVTFTLVGDSARLKAGSQSNVLSVTVMTDPNGLATAELTPQSNIANELRVHVKTPGGAEGDGTPQRFEINP